MKHATQCTVAWMLWENWRRTSHWQLKELMDCNTWDNEGATTEKCIHNAGGQANYVRKP